MRTAVLNARAAPASSISAGPVIFISTTASRAAGHVQALGAEGARVLKVQPGLPTEPFGTFWRFLVADDPDVDRYIVRDADSVVNIRECVAVQEWLASDRHFHVMRDNYDHGELILAGMWGGVRAALPPVGPWARRYLASRTDLPGRTADQEFLRDQLWPTIRTSVMTHDSQFAFGERRDFPATWPLSARRLLRRLRRAGHAEPEAGNSRDETTVFDRRAHPRRRAAGFGLASPSVPASTVLIGGHRHAHDPKGSRSRKPTMTLSANAHSMMPRRRRPVRFSPP